MCICYKMIWSLPLKCSLLPVSCLLLGAGGGALVLSTAVALSRDMGKVSSILFVSCRRVLICFLWLLAQSDCCEMFCIICSASFLTKTVPCGNELHKFLIWDTAGQERVSTPTPEITHLHAISFKLTHDLVNHISENLSDIFLHQEAMTGAVISLSGSNDGMELL